MLLRSRISWAVMFFSGQNTVVKANKPTHTNDISHTAVALPMFFPFIQGLPSPQKFLNILNIQSILNFHNCLLFIYLPLVCLNQDPNKVHILCLLFLDYLFIVLVIHLLNKLSCLYYRFFFILELADYTPVPSFNVLCFT